ncbi:MAG: ribosome-binding factor A [Chloroflexi bacterium]|nr:ribosome-binding factor A [Chloroflexota bacterium]|tara:strand:+ start:716 stop:1081 length:366 start_codon:yes stop_codon:yes gene_type:complete
MSKRTEKVGDLIQTVLAEQIDRKLKHPDITSIMISITRVDVTPDFSHAKIYVSILGDELSSTKAIDALTHSSTYLHRQLIQEIHLRKIPKLEFIEDRSMEESEKFNTLLKSIDGTFDLKKE